MKFASISSLAPSLLVAGALLSQPNVFAHGGTYRGPGDTVPPVAGGGGLAGAPITPGVGSPDSPGLGGSNPTTPHTPTGAPNGQGGGNPSTGYGQVGGDLSAWSFWWEFNKDSYLNLKDAVQFGVVRTGSVDWFLGKGQEENSKDSMRPTAEEIRNKIVPALLNAIAKETQPDIVTGAMLALAKIGDEVDDYGNSKFAESFTNFLDDNNSEIAETAVIALGILANDSSVSILRDLLEDTSSGRQLVRSNEVNYRMRSFAAYGLALVGSQTGEELIRQSIFASLQATLESDDSSTRDIKVACLIAMGLVPLEKLGFEELGSGPQVPLGGELGTIQTRRGQLIYLMEYFENDANHFNVRAHVPTAICRLLSGAESVELKTRATKMFLSTLGSDAKREVLQSCVLALGQLGDTDPEGIDQEIRAALKKVKNTVSDDQTRNFTAIALAQAGSRMGSEDPSRAILEVSKYLLNELSKGRNAIRPWAALAMGIFGDGLGSDVPASVVEALHFELKGERTPRIGAYAVGAGIMGDTSFADTLLEKLQSISDDDARGYICVALGMIGEPKAILPIQEILNDSSYRPQLLRQAAIALGLLGDRKVVDDLVKKLESARSLATQAALSSALGFIGDRRSIDPLVNLLENHEASAAARGFAAVALGIVADKENLPWNSRIAADLNYRASTVTLNDQEGRGILNIL